MLLKKEVLLLVLMIIALSETVFSQDGPSPVTSDRIVTQWANEVDAAKPLQEYPRPQLERKDWQNLNGPWEYALASGKLGEAPAAFDGTITVPYPVESALSGVQKTVGQDHTLWYKRKISLNATPKKDEKLLLHFGAVDWQAEVYVNGKKVGSHQGGYDPFSFDITSYLQSGKEQEIVVGVWDPTDDGPQPRGKQVNKPEGIWYTPVTGIWQTVWLEKVAKTHLVSTRHTPDIDKNILWIETEISEPEVGDQIHVSAWDNGKKVTEVWCEPGSKTILSFEDPKRWSPEDPFLYDLKYEVVRKGKVVDEAASYFAFRKISLQKDQNGIQRMLLNNEFVFQYGPLDQGWWPDGLYTAPTDEALKFDIEKTKEMGFNMIRKHVKVEPARWYYYADKLGLLVWQDMPSGDIGGHHWDNIPGKIMARNHEKERSAESEEIYKKEWKAIMDALYNFPSIVVWVPFNEAWGQFKTVEITEWTEQYDPSRLVNSASGGNFYPTGHILDMHNYPDAAMPDPSVFGKNRALVLGEFGGLGLPVEGHTWQQKDNWGYQSFKNKEELKKRYERLIEELSKLIPLGLSAAVYTQTTDVEVEVNGLMTYDRAILKIPAEELKEIHDKLY